MQASTIPCRSLSRLTRLMSNRLLSGLFLSLLWLSAGCQDGQGQRQAATYGASHEAFAYQGRFQPEGPTGDSLLCSWSGSRIDFRFTGDQLTLRMEVLPGAEPPDAGGLRDFYRVQINDSVQVLQLRPDQDRYLVARNLGAGPHRVTLFKRTEPLVAMTRFRGVTLAAGGTLLPPASSPKRGLLFIGNSITCGYGNEGKGKEENFLPETEDAWRTYSHLTAQALDAAYHCVAYSGRGVYRNYRGTREGLLGELLDRYHPQDTAARWDFHWQPDWVVINLGTNDFGQGTPPREEFVQSYVALLQQIRARYPSAGILCLLSPMVTDQKRLARSTLGAYIDEALARADLANTHRFDLSVQGELGYGSNWHPSLAQHRRNAEELIGWFQEHAAW